MLTDLVALARRPPPRMTRGIDFVIPSERADAVRRYAKVGHDCHVSGDAVQCALESERVFNVLHLEGVIEVGLVLRDSTPDRRLQFERRHVADLGGPSVRVVSREGRILSKLARARDAGSARQRQGVRSAAAERYGSGVPVSAG
jgi:hypothetical protein